MKKSIFLTVLLMGYLVAKAQTLSLEELKAKKGEVSSDIIQLKDEEVAYPVIGLIEMHMEQVVVGGSGQGGGGGLFAVIEYWVIDSKGKIVYNNVYSLNPQYAPNNEAITDADYMHYMDMNGKFLMRKRKAVATIEIY